MKIEIIEKKIPSTDGVHILSGAAFVPEDEIRGLFHVVHGMREYIMRYESFLREMAEYGFVVFGYDHLGHGGTANDDSELGFIAHTDGWKYLVDDVAAFGNAMKKEYGEKLPYILMGHSMGSFIVRLAAEKYSLHDKLIIMGTGGPNPGTDAGIMLCRLIKRRRGEKYISAGIEKLAFGSYNKRFGGDDKFGWLSNIESVRRAYAADKYCSFSFTVSAMEDLLHLTAECNRKGWFSSAVIEKPILLLSGEDDPVGDYGRGVIKVQKALEKNGADTELKLFKGCRHEILNDICRERVIEIIKSFSI